MKLKDSGVKEYFYFFKIKCVYCVVFVVVVKMIYNDDRWWFFFVRRVEFVRIKK